jgi:hypothetical protein
MMIENLPLLTPDTSRGAKTIARCHHRLAARRRRRVERDKTKIEKRNRQPSPRALGAERLLVTGFCVAYLIAMAGDLLAIAARR